MRLVIILRIICRSVTLCAKDTDKHFCKDYSKYLWIKGYEPLFLASIKILPMKKLLSTHYTDLTFNISLFLLRVVPGVMMMVNHGYDKLVHFADRRNKFMDFLGMGSTTTLSLAIFAEFFCAFLVIIGLFTRFSVLPLVIEMGVALFKANHGEIFNGGEDAALFLTAFTAILFVGPGKFSVDGIMGK
jgi:putative oxidoreductase